MGYRSFYLIFLLLKCRGKRGVPGTRADPPFSVSRPFRNPDRLNKQRKTLNVPDIPAGENRLGRPFHRSCNYTGENVKGTECAGFIPDQALRSMRRRQIRDEAIHPYSFSYSLTDE